MKKSEELKNKINVIKNIIKDIKVKHAITTQEEIENYFWTNHKNMMDSYPFLISQLASGKDNLMLNHMLDQIKLIEEGHSKDNIEKQLGEKLAKEYIKPVINEKN